MPVIELPSLVWDYTRTPYSDALEVATENRPKEFNQYYKHYYHSGLRFKIDRNGDLARDNLIDQGPILAYLDGLDSFHLIYSIRNGFFSWSKITPFRSICWFWFPAEINDHFPGDYARKIKKIVAENK